jgi:hypothetical protein
MDVKIEMQNQNQKTTITIIFSTLHSDQFALLAQRLYFVVQQMSVILSDLPVLLSENHALRFPPSHKISCSVSLNTTHHISDALKP